MDKTEATKGLKLATSFFDFIVPEIYQEQRYSVKQIEYWIWSELNQELQSYKVTEALRYDMIEPYIENELLYIK